MARRLPPALAAACLCAGAGLWISRATFDRITGPGAGVRVALLPSWPELVGLTVLAAIVIVLAASAVRGLTAVAASGPWARADPDAAWPALSLAWLALPFLPWLADAVPALDGLAGPGALLLWALVLAQVTRAAFAPPDAAPRHGARWTVAAILAGGLVLYGGAATQFAGTPLAPGGDEPHYLVIAQSLLTDGDLEIGNNHDRGDYHAYYPAPLRPHYVVTGREGAIYSIHPVGLPVLLVPAFAAGGYAGVVVALVILSAVGAALAWHWARRLLADAGAATFAWVAAAASAPFALQSFAVYPEIAGGVAALAALAWPFGGRAAAGPSWTWAARGVLVALLPWLSSKYAPMALVILCALAWRARGTRARVWLVAPVAASVVAWLAFFQAYWGVPLPSAPYGNEHQLAAANLLVGVPGLLFDQEYGVLPYAPALLLAVPGSLRLWRRGGEWRRVAVETTLAAGALLGTVATYHIWWGGSASPGRPVVAGLLLMVPALAAEYADTVRHPVRRAFAECLALAGLTVTGAMILARGGLLVANRRDGTSELLEWIAPGSELTRLVPSFAGGREALVTPLVLAAAWVVVALVAFAVAARIRGRSAGADALAGATVALVSLTAGAAIVGAFGDRLPPRAPLAARAQVPLLDGFDRVARPLALVYDPLRAIDVDQVPGLVELVATPGLRPHPQPLPVLMNARFTLPAGRYALSLEPRESARLAGTVGLQIGRTGGPMTSWSLDEPPGAPWTVEIALPLDASFVGLRAGDDVRSAAGRLTLRPISVVDAGDRPRAPLVLGAAAYERASAYFHTETVYAEPTGFWTRGNATSVLTLVVPEPTAAEGVGAMPRLRLHGGAGRPSVQLRSGAWSEALRLEPGAVADVTLPWVTGQRRLALEIQVTGGFVPAEHGGTDRRTLGCWVEFVGE